MNLEDRIEKVKKKTQSHRNRHRLDQKNTLGDPNSRLASYGSRDYKFGIQIEKAELMTRPFCVKI